MNRKILVHSILALLVSLTAGFLVLAWLQGKTQSAVPLLTESPKSSIVVSQAPLSRGSKLDPGKLTLVPYFQESVPVGSFTDAAALRDRVIATAIGVNEPITEAKLFPAGTAGGLEAMISAGKRAVGIKGNKALGVGGLILPGARVDVLMTVDDPSSETGKAITAKVVLENVLVLATGTESEKKAGSKEEISYDTYTLEVAPDEAEKLALASHQGQLNLALRRPLDDVTVNTKGANIKSNLESFKDVTQKRMAESIRGTTVEKSSLETVSQTNK